MKILVWDLPTRLFHWLLVLSFVAAWLTSDSDRWLDVHVFVGYLLAGLIVFRLVWGFAGSRYAKFKAFAFKPGEVFAYLHDVLRRDARRYIGHNPAGSWAIYLLLALGLLVAASGLMVLGGEEQHGPLAGFVGFATGELFKELHEIMAWLMLGVAGLHLAGVALESRLHRENLPRAMITGCKRGRASDGIPSGHKIAGAVLLAVVIGCAAWYFKGYIGANESRPHRPFVGKQLPDNAVWRTECSSCHLAYHPTLLPARSWERTLREQDRHFGEALGLDAAATQEILAFLIRYSADSRMTEAAWKIGKSIPAAVAPLRITETGYWKKKHDEITGAVWRSKKVGAKSNCGACHRDAESGTFEDAAMRLPAR